MVNFTDLPTELLELLFDYLDDANISKISETCRRFKEVVETSDKLMKKLKLHVNIPSQFNSFRSMISRSTRRYRNVIITRTRCRSAENYLTNLSTAFERIADDVRCVTINWCQLRSLDIAVGNFVDITSRRRIRPDGVFNLASRQEGANIIRDDIRDELHKEFVLLLKQFKHLRKLELNNVNMEKKTNPNELTVFNFSSLKELKLRHCDPYCFDFLTTSKRLLKLTITEPCWSNIREPGIDNFETFLIAQEELTNLEIYSVQYPRLFQTDRTADIRFRLNHLVLNNVFFKDKTIAENFFQTQNQLKSIDFLIQNEKAKNLDQLNWYNKIIKIILTENSMLKTINIEKNKYKFTNCDFLTNVTNSNVRELNFSSDGDASLFKCLIKSLPNLNTITYKSESNEDNDEDICFDKSTTLEKLNSLIIFNASIASLMNVYAENLQVFEYSPKLNGMFIDDHIGGFLHRHKTIKDLRIGTKAERSYFFVSFNLCEIIVNFLNQLESITIYNFAEVNKSVKLLCTLGNLKSLTLSSQQYQQFTAKTKVECERMKLKLIPVDIKYPCEIAFENREFFDP